MPDDLLGHFVTERGNPRTEWKRIPANPPCGLTVRAPKALKLRERDLTDDEAATILWATLGTQPPNLALRPALARRWVPWLCATPARGSAARAAGIPAEIADRLQSHAPSNAGGKYGFVPLVTLRDAIERLPQYEVAVPAP